MIARLILSIFLLLPLTSNAEDSLFSSMRVSSQGMQIQNERLKVIAQNIANANVTAKTPDAKPYTRKILIIKDQYDEMLRADLTIVDEIVLDKTDYLYKLEPNHPAADNHGYVRYPNVDINLEMIDAKEAQRSYEANLSAFEIAKTNQSKLLEALR